MSNSDALWFMYGQQILKLAAPAFDPTKQQFGLASTTLVVDLGNANSEVVNDYVYQIGNTIPAASPAYVPGSSLLTAYRAFLDSIDLGGDPNPNLDSLINQATATLNAAQSNYLSVQSQAVTAWQTYKAINPNISFSDYVTQQFPIYIQAKNALSGAESKYETLMTQRYGVGYEIIAGARDNVSATGGAADLTMKNAFNMAIKTGAVAAPGGVPVLPGQTPPAASASLVESFAPAFSMDGFAAKYAEWQAASGGGAGSAATVHVTGDAGSADWEAMGWSVEAAVGVGFDFFEAFGEHDASSDTETAFSTTSNFDMEISFLGLGAFSVAPGSWFDDGLIASYKSKLLPNSPNLFGPGGSLARMPYQALIGFQPTIKMSMSTGDYSSFKSTYQSETTTGFGFGPFVVGETHSSTYANKSAVAYDDASSTITIAPPPSTLPLLLGVISARLDV
ncbi:MAG TPA: hypothetical protein VFP12_16150 [Allosphingosinicella sp.]|nr:hypothetical protein [Allosphingosinicella sp.]